MCLLRARCLQQTGIQLGNAADGYDEQLRGRGWGLSVSRNGITWIALIYFPLHKVHVVGFTPGSLCSCGCSPRDAVAQCTSICPGASPAGTFPRLPRHCHHLHDIALGSEPQGPSEGRQEKGGDDDKDSGKRKEVPEGCGSFVPKHQLQSGTASHKAWVSQTLLTFIPFPASAVSKCLPICWLTGSPGHPGCAVPVVRWRVASPLQGAGSELHPQVLALLSHLPCHQLSPQASPDCGIMPYQVPLGDPTTASRPGTNHILASLGYSK